MLDASGDQVGKVRDVVVQNRANARPPRVKGMVVELLRLRRVFLPMERVHSIDAQQVIISGVVNTVRFQRREQERLVVADLFDKRVARPDALSSTIFDVAIEHSRTRLKLSAASRPESASPTHGSTAENRPSPSAICARRARKTFDCGPTKRRLRP